MTEYTEDIKKLNLWEKISQISSEVVYLQKDDKVGFGNNSYKAISIEKVMGAISEKMCKFGVVIYPVEQEYKRQDEKVINSKGEEKTNRISDVNVKYEVLNIHNPMEKFITVSSGTGVDTQDKGIGKAMTYAYKNMIIKLFAIATGDDTDKVHSDEYTNKLLGTKETAATTTGGITEPQYKRLLAIAKKKGVNPSAVVQTSLKSFNKPNPMDLTKTEYDELVSRLEAKVDK